MRKGLSDFKVLALYEKADIIKKGARRGPERFILRIEVSTEMEGWFHDYPWDNHDKGVVSVVKLLKYFNEKY